MNLQNTNKNPESKALQQVSQHDTVQILLTGKIDELSKKLPSKIEGTFELPKVREMVVVAGESLVLQFVETELVKLAALVNVSGNLTDFQVETIAKYLIDTYPNETIADFKICFTSGAMGKYGQIFRLDGIVISDWMKQHLDEKYKILEDQLMKERDEYYKIVLPVNSERDWLAEWQNAVNQSDGLKLVPKLSDEEINDEGQPKPKPKVYRFDESEAEIRLREHHEKLWNHQEQSVRERHPEFTEEQIQTRLKELKETILYEEGKPKHTFGIAKIWAKKKKKSA
jgi:hypothetical protein